MLLEVLEIVIFLETFPFVKWYYTELANVDSLKRKPKFDLKLSKAIVHHFYMQKFNEMQGEIISGAVEFDIYSVLRFAAIRLYLQEIHIKSTEI
jgi:hypothetical protein